MVRSGVECLKMVFQTLLKMIIELRIHQTTENYEQAMGNNVLKQYILLGDRNLPVKDCFAKGSS